MLIIGLTGSIGMGKSTAAARFAANGIAVFDADAEVHRLYAGEAAPLIGKAFPGTVEDGVVDRSRLAASLAQRKGAISDLEAIVHPLVRASEYKFLLEQEQAGAAMAVLEIPLLFETGGDCLVDVTIVVSAPEAVQRERVLARPGMNEERLDHLLANQMPDAEKRKRADFVVDTSGPIEETGQELDRIIESLRGRKGEALVTWKAEAKDR